MGLLLTKFQELRHDINERLETSDQLDDVIELLDDFGSQLEDMEIELANE